jgi:uncharacterized protein with ATP-grasp and redox domains
MNDYAGITVRSETLLKAGLKYLRDLKSKVTITVMADNSHTLMRSLETLDLMDCGEIIFDQLVIKYFKQNGSHITLAVKGAPILNDATVEDVVSIGMDKQVDMLTTTGSGDIGISIEKLPSELSDAIERCTLIIAKGMANYESLNERYDLPPIAYLMAVKCAPIASSVGAPKGSYIALLSEK